MSETERPRKLDLHCEMSIVLCGKRLYNDRFDRRVKILAARGLRVFRIGAQRELRDEDVDLFFRADLRLFVWGSEVHTPLVRALRTLSLANKLKSGVVVDVRSKDRARVDPKFWKSLSGEERRILTQLIDTDRWLVDKLRSDAGEERHGVRPYRQKFRAGRGG